MGRMIGSSISRITSGRVLPYPENVQEDAKLAFVRCADYGILDFSVIIAPSTANLPYP